MIYFVISVAILYFFSFLFYYRRLFPIQKRSVLPFLLLLVIITVSYLFMNDLTIRWLKMVIIMTTMVFCIRFSTGMDWLQAFYGGACSVLVAYSFRGIFTVISVFILHKRDFSNVNYYLTNTVLILPFVLLFCLFLRKTILPDNKLKLFLYNYNQLKFVVIYEIAAVLNLTVMNSGLYIFSYDVWFSENGLSSWGTWFVIMGLGNCLLSIGMLIYAIYQSIQGTELIEYQWRAQMLEEQYERQMRHYKSYQKYTESFRAFKHDYQSMMASLKLLIRENDNEKALELIDDMFNEMQKKVQIHKRYSDSVVLDGMMQDLANICEEKGIRLSSNIAVPRDTKMTMLDMIRIFSNFTNNAVEACQKVPVPDRFIEIISTNRQQWATLQVANCYDGNIHMKNGQFLTTKMEKQNHGLGLLIVKEIAENLGGFVIYETDSENKTFLIRIHIPRTK